MADGALQPAEPAPMPETDVPVTRMAGPPGDGVERSRALRLVEASSPDRAAPDDGAPDPAGGAPERGA